MMVNKNDNENKNKNDTTSASSIVNNTGSNDTHTTDNQHKTSSISTSSDTNVNNVSNTTDASNDSKTADANETSSVSANSDSASKTADTTSDSDSNKLLTIVNNNTGTDDNLVKSDVSADTASTNSTATNASDDVNGKLDAGNAGTVSTHGATDTTGDAGTANMSDLSVDSDSADADSDGSVSGNDVVSTVSTASTSSDSDDTSSAGSADCEGQFVGVGSAHDKRANKHHNHSKRAGINTASAKNDKSASSNSINQTAANIEQPGWIYWLMVFISIISVLSIIYGSYNLHEKQNLENTTIVIYDAQSDSWHVDPMYEGLSITTTDSNTGKNTTSTISEFKQFKSSDMRIFTKIDASKNSMSNWRSQNPSDYKFTDGDIASMRCKEPKLNDDNSIACSGSAIISITGNDKPLVNYIRQHEIPGHEDD